ncbi:hypothetical protein, conserved [Eimeria necatrix]|uniref:Uncharacterized protein n=1 Tax=Eimeria necatrix TaxID=51315 RepID=U6MNN4_9EIME|nr:hypothetical protein, conserved [Eimeria necatrix]CDJ64054.1 hypothetical protein, conserved [Eimeria necatrix]
MPLKKFGDKIKSSLQHLSPKSKKRDDAVEGDLSPCSLPTVATAKQQQPESNEPAGSQPSKTGGETESPKYDQQKAPNQEERNQIVADVVHMKPPSPPAALSAPASLPAVAEGMSTPRWEESAQIFPTMFYTVKTHSKEPLNQSVLLVNPSRSDQTFNLRLEGGNRAELEKNVVTIQGDYVERVTVTITPENDTEDVYIDLLQGNNLYDKIRVQTQML